MLLALEVNPDPIVLGAEAHVAAKLHLSTLALLSFFTDLAESKDINRCTSSTSGETVSEGSGHTVSLEIYKKFFGAWIYVPCVENVGSCTISNICDKIHNGSDCPLAPWYARASSQLYSSPYFLLLLLLTLHVFFTQTGECLARAPSTPLPTPFPLPASPSSSTTPTSAGSPTYAPLLSHGVLFLHGMWCLTFVFFVFSHVQGDLKVKATLNDASGKRLACYQIIASITTS